MTRVCTRSQIELGSRFRATRVGSRDTAAFSMSSKYGVSLRFCVFLALSAGCTAISPPPALDCASDVDCLGSHRCESGRCRRLAGMSNAVNALGDTDAAAAVRADAAATNGGAGVPATSESPDAGPVMDAAPTFQPDAATMTGTRAGGPAMDAMLEGGFDAAPPLKCPERACEPGGTCRIQGSDWLCDCDPDFEGTGSQRCTKVDDCPSGACVPGGQCVDGVRDYACTCEHGYSGGGTKQCTNIDDCPRGACEPYGTCEDGLDSFVCRCDGPVGVGDTCPYRDNGDGSVYDSITGLTWKKTAQPSAQDPSNADRSVIEAQCQRFGSGWRLPTQAELYTTEVIFPDTPGCLACEPEQGGITFLCGVWQGDAFVRCVR